MIDNNKPKRIAPLDIEVYKKGICFICGKACDSKHYAHYECCLSYARHKEIKQQEHNIATGN